MLNAILWDFHQGRNYSRGMWGVQNPSNTKVTAATAQPAQKQNKHGKKHSRPNASCWKEDGRNRGKHERLGHFGDFQERAMLNAILWDFHQGGNYSRGMRGVQNPSNTKVTAATAQPAQKQNKHGKKHSRPNASCWKEDGRNRGKHERLGHFGALPGKSHVECHSVGFPPGKKLF